VLQFFLIVLGIAPLVYIGMHRAGGWEGIVQNVDNAKLHLWKGIDHFMNDPCYQPEINANKKAAQKAA
jgi:SSS family solute:Na+ symporter